MISCLMIFAWLKSLDDLIKVESLLCGIMRSDDWFLWVGFVKSVNFPVVFVILIHKGSETRHLLMHSNIIIIIVFLYNSIFKN